MLWCLIVHVLLIVRCLLIKAPTQGAELTNAVTRGRRAAPRVRTETHGLVLCCVSLHHVSGVDVNFNAVINQWF